MKATIFSMLMLVLAATSFGAGEILVGNFENSMDGFWAAGWNAGDSATPDQMYPTLDQWSLKCVVAKGGWVELAEKGLGGTPAQAALGSVGKITLDATAFYNTGSSNDYHQICILLNANGLWTVEGYVNMAASGTTASYTIQLSADSMAKIAAASSYANIGLFTNSSGTESSTDPETGETIVKFDGMMTTYFDNVQIVPEPATLGLLSLGALSLIKRKR